MAGTKPLAADNQIGIVLGEGVENADIRALCNEKKEEVNLRYYAFNF